ncbi:putative cinnamoyl-CoA reductase [Xylaria bambusicola]|uniref:putative cinnamoyl-CoA reductase n=1 Tax=Xylaria bambusicola TaxID=326684 RepID=UPI002007FE86|nr:putative cinnamoyl-CoA reductase [Xylaria bambusicola]KAI0517576.1 putative cinnamoyl-CoA reductase [Xylaria bambusicola]
MSDQRVIVVIGATSNQGDGVVSALIGDPKAQWIVRGVTRDTSSPWAKEFMSKYEAAKDRVSLISGDVYSAESMRAALSGAYGVFLNTNQTVHGKTLVQPEELRQEVEQGRIIVDAAKHCGVKHFVFSSLPDMVKATGGRFTDIYHMDLKYEIEQYARSQLDCVTAVIPGLFYSNHVWSHYCRLRGDGVVRFCAPIPGPRKMQWTDPAYDVGVFTNRIFDLGVEKTAGKVYPAISPMISMDEIAAIFTRVTGRKAVHDPLTSAEWAEFTIPMLGPAFRDDIKHMMDWFSMAPTDKICYGALDPEEDTSAEELGVTASTFEDWIKRTGWTGPTEVYEG